VKDLGVLHYILGIEVSPSSFVHLLLQRPMSPGSHASPDATTSPTMIAPDTTSSVVPSSAPLPGPVTRLRHGIHQPKV
jgi:hypothetical protein